ncbi:MAG: hypothetical protein DRG30_06160 [Epsilonproteobacteria bacterium]|nr:MAG: hypothetical protein DRG30_06160 [Campylobacterota bacterium]
MGAFSKDMRKVATDLIKQFGNTCVLTKVNFGTYDPLTGDTTKIRTDFPTYSALKRKINVSFGDDGKNTNLSAFDDSSITIAWFGEEVDSTWEYNGSNIKSATPTMSQDDVIIYDLTIGEKIA